MESAPEMGSLAFLCHFGDASQGLTENAYPRAIAPLSDEAGNAPGT